MQKTLVRPAHRADFPLLLEIDQGCFEPGIAYDFAELSYYIKRPGARTLVAEVEGKTAGFILIDMWVKRRSATIITLDIRSEYRRSGVATELLLNSEDFLRAENIRNYNLQADVSNSAALAFYRKHGFEIVRTLPEYY